MGSLMRKMTAEERAVFQALVDESFTRFKDVVKEGRPRFSRDPAALEKIATGQVYTAQQATANGLVDKIGFLEDAVDQAVKMAGLSSDEVRVIEYKREFSLLDIALGEAKAAKPGLDLESFAELATPKAYYLCTWLEPLITKEQ
jgi:protease-4